VLRGEIDLTNCPGEERPQVQESMFRDLLCLETVQVDRTNAILQEQREFVASVRHGDPVRVTGEQGRDALAVAEQILDSIRSHRWNSQLPNAIGPHALFQPERLQPKRAA
jgi:predicted dehydrogenase